MSNSFARPRPSPRVARTVWLCGVAAAVFLWAGAAGAIGFASEPAPGLAFQGKLFAPFALLIAGWTGGWLCTRRERPAVPAAR
jgi:hypothetical protein